MNSEKKSEGKNRSLAGTGKWVLNLLLGSMPVACIIYILDIQTYLNWSFYKEQYLGLFLVLFLASVFISIPAGSRSARSRVPWYDWGLAAISAAVFGNVVFFYNDLVIMSGFATPSMVIMGGLAVLLILEAARRVVGLPLIIVGIVLLLYARFAYLFPGLLNARGVSWSRLFTSLYIDPNSILGIPTGVAGGMVIAFLLFGASLFMVGGGEFLSDLAMALMGRQRGGAAKVAVIASGLFGSLSGSASANVAVTGAVTIPLMKKTGYSATFAGAVEATASTGGLVLPPVMGITAFMMAEFLGLPYYEVALSAAIPAILYYVALLLQVHLRALERGIHGLSPRDLPTLGNVFKKGWPFVIPIAGLLYFLFIMHLNPTASAVYASAIVILVGLYRKENRTNFFNKLIEIFIDTGRQTLVVAAACSVAGIVIGSVSVTNLGLNLSDALIAASGGSAFFLLVLAAIGAVILGMGMPIAATYIMLVILIVPALEHVGIQPLAAHMFINFFGAMSFVTPPVCVAAYVAAGIAKCKPMATGFLSTRLGIGAYLVPFAFCYSTGLLLQGSWLNVLYALLPTTIGIVFIAIGLAGYCTRRLDMVHRAVFTLAGLGLLFPTTPFRLAGLILGGLLLVKLIWHKKSKQPVQAEELA
jgi:TRAP transporter 4TM/12TM fusion protein